MISDNSKLCNITDTRPYMLEILKEDNLYKRLNLYKQLHKKAAKLSQPLIEFHIKKTEQKIALQHASIDLLF